MNGKISEVVQVGPSHVSPGLMRSFLVSVANYFRNQNIILDTETDYEDDDDTIMRLEESQPALEQVIADQLKAWRITT